MVGAKEAGSRFRMYGSRTGAGYQAGDFAYGERRTDININQEPVRHQTMVGCEVVGSCCDVQKKLVCRNGMAIV